MWESPIDAIYNDVQTTFENDVLKAVRSVHINVDKEELIKALAYDRNQYEKGYADGKRDAIKRGKWKTFFHGTINSETIFSHSCSMCWHGAISNVKTPFCAYCGAKMDEEG